MAWIYRIKDLVKVNGRRKVVTQSFEGFRSFPKKTLAYCAVLAVVTYDGDFDYYALDPQNIEMGVSELQRMYRMMNGELGNVRVAVYRRDKIEEPSEELTKQEE